MDKKNRNRLILAIIIVLLLSMFAAALFVLSRINRNKPYEVDDADYELRGVDLSAHNGIVDFEKLHGSGIDFVILKASEGMEFRDSNFEHNYEKASEHKFYVGAYHFFRFDVDGISQARNFMSAVDDKDLDLPLVVDVEEHGNPYVFIKSKVVRQLQDMVDELSANDYKVMIYTNKDGYEKFVKGNFDDYPLWICSFTPPSYVEWTIWQYSHSGNVDGVDGNVDLNIFYGNGLQWKQWLQ